MKAVICTKFGSPEVLQLKEIEKPTPKDKEVLIRVHATSVCFGDLMARNFKAITPRNFNMTYLFWLNPTYLDSCQLFYDTQGSTMIYLV